jgi:chitosanase
MSDCSLKKKKIETIVNVFETGSLEGNYGDVSIFRDGPNRMRQITYGRSQTTEWGHLGELMALYVENKGASAVFFAPYLSKFGKTSLVNDTSLISELKKVGKEQIMQDTQNAFFDKDYWNPACEFYTDNKFTLPLSMLVIYDSYIHSGGILDFLRKKFPESPPVKGGDEQKWITQYLNVRNSWLENHSNLILRKTTYRTKNMIAARNYGNWNLEKPFNANGLSVV